MMPASYDIKRLHRIPYSRIYKDRYYELLMYNILRVSPLRSKYTVTMYMYEVGEEIIDLYKHILTNVPYHLFIENMTPKIWGYMIDIEDEPFIVFELPSSKHRSILVDSLKNLFQAIGPRRSLGKNILHLYILTQINNAAREDSANHKQVPVLYKPVENEEGKILHMYFSNANHSHLLSVMNYASLIS